MRIQLKEGVIVLIAETDQERREVADWGTNYTDHALSLTLKQGRTLLLKDLGARSEACREPINIISSANSKAIRLISNLAHTPFELHGHRYAGIEGFWQGLKFPDQENRRRIAQLHGRDAKQAGHQAPETEVFYYRGARIRVGCHQHWSLMRQACWAKFTQHASARRALLDTGSRPLTHKTRRDSRTIPGVIMADIWMRIRTDLQDGKHQDSDMSDVIGPFTEEYRWLSNFFPAPVTLDDMSLPSVEHAYQAAKTLKPSERRMIQSLATPGQAKRASRQLSKRADWPQVKLAVMEDLLRQKFAVPELRRRLRLTHPYPLVELNTWNDVFWGVCKGQGENHLGRLLMMIRDDILREQDDSTSI